MLSCALSLSERGADEPPPVSLRKRGGDNWGFRRGIPRAARACLVSNHRQMRVQCVFGFSDRDRRRVRIITEPLPNRLLSILVFSENQDWRTESYDRAIGFGECPLIGPIVHPLCILLEQTHAPMARRITGQVEFVKRDARKVIKVETPR